MAIRPNIGPKVNPKMVYSLRGQLKYMGFSEEDYVKDLKKDYGIDSIEELSVANFYNESHILRD